MKVLAMVVVIVLTPALAKPVWHGITDANDPQGTGRRLTLQIASSHTNMSDEACVVGGFDDSNYAKVYVGGPCSQFNATTMTPLAGFRYVAMETVDLDLCDNNNSCAPMQHIVPGNGYPVLRSLNNVTHAEVGLAGLFTFPMPAIAEAGFFASTTSYLSKGSFTFNTNTFVIGKAGNTYENINICIKNCCDAVPSQGCDCGGVCPTTKLSVEPGDFKYSLLSAAVDLEASSVKGWAKVIDLFGATVGGAKQLQGVQYTYQVIDFTEMGADSVTITPPTGSATTFSGMSSCTLAQVDAGSGCTPVNVKTVTVAANGWEGVSYTFPMYYNTGTWTKAASGALSSTPGQSKQVVIEAIKFDDASMTTLIGSDYVAGTTKMMLIRYTFDISGVTGTDTSGKYMVYDPTVNTVTQANAKAAAGGSSSGGGSPSGSSSGSSSGGGSSSGVTAGATSTSLSWNMLLLSLVIYLK